MDNTTSATTAVVALDSYRKAQRLQALHRIETYWHRLRGGCGIPRRSDVDPRDMRGVLDHTFILERIAPGVARVRIAGQHIKALTGQEARGLPLSVLFEVPARDALARQLERVFSDPAIVCLPIVADGPTGPVKAEMLMLPLMSEQGRVSRALGGISTFSEIRQASRRLTLARGEVRVDRIDTERQLDHLVASFAEDPAPFAHRTPSAPERPALHLVQDSARS
ncbi:PAS domain-containing protein [Aestuariibius sp. 2305UL40-4]|uniref:PAS domain-containing protein n=1 Tax=Aestuariibius violaceus TaxID=3234132 RepID=UPI00345E9B4F